jgi:hypothetical protein
MPPTPTRVDDATSGNGTAGHVRQFSTDPHLGR